MLTAVHKYVVTFDELQAPKVSEREQAELFASDWQVDYRYDQENGLWRRWDSEVDRWEEARHWITVDVGAHLEKLRKEGRVTVDGVSKSKIHAVRDLAADFAVQQFDPDPDVLALPWNELLDTTTGKTAKLTREHYITPLHARWHRANPRGSGTCGRPTGGSSCWTACSSTPNWTGWA